VIKKYIDIALQQYTQIRSSKFFKVFIWDVLSKGADYALLPIYLKILSQEEYGFYTYVLYIIATTSGIIKLGIDTAVSKMYYETEQYDRGTMLFSANSIWAVFFVGLLSLCLFTGIDKIVFSNLLSIPEINYLQIRLFIFAFILFNLIQTTLNVFFVIDDNALVYQKYNLIRTVVGNAIVIGLLLFFAKDNKAYFRLYIEPVVFLLSFIPLMVIFIKRMTFTINWDAIKHGLKIGLPMVGTLIVGVIYNISDKYFLQKTSGFNTLAVYNLALFLTLPISLIFSSFQTVWFPQFLQVKSPKERFDKSNRFSITLIYTYLGIFSFIWVGLIIFIYVGLFPKTYLPIISLFPIIFVAKIAESLTQIYNNFIVAWGKTQFNLLVSIFFGLTTLFLNYFIIPDFGIQGTVAILLIMSISRVITFFLFVKKNINGTIH
jgi:O-antigen/teichoic acid export membrane protein